MGFATRTTIREDVSNVNDFFADSSSSLEKTSRQEYLEILKGLLESSLNSCTLNIQEAQNV